MSVHPLLMDSQGMFGTVATCRYGHTGHGVTRWEAHRNLDRVCLAAGPEPDTWPIPAWTPEDP